MTASKPMNYALATSRTWNEIIARRLEERTGCRFHLIRQKEELSLERLEEIKPRFIFLPHWSYIIPEAIFNNCECVIFHMTDLPYGRGGSPLQNLIQQGHKDTVISALRCVHDIDAGPVYLRRSLCLEGAASEIFLRAAEIIEEMILDIVQQEPVPVAQKGEPSYFRRRQPAESNLDTACIQNLNDFFDFIRMLDADGYPRAFVEVHNHRLELLRVQMEPDRLTGTFVIYKQHSLPENRGGLNRLLNKCFPNPPRNVYERMLDSYKPSDPFYTLELDNNLAGMVYCSRHSKGGCLENLAIDPQFRGLGLSRSLVTALIQDHSGVITLTTRIPTYFKIYGFEVGCRLKDGSTFMFLES